MPLFPPQPAPWVPGDAFWGYEVQPPRVRHLHLKVEGSLPNNSATSLGVVGTPDAYVRQMKGGADVRAVGPDPLNPPRLRIFPAGGRTVGWATDCNDGFGGGSGDDHRGAAGHPPTGSANNDASYVCEWKLTNVRTFFELYFLTEGVAGADGDPNWGGPSAGDVNPRAIGVRFYEVAVAGDGSGTDGGAVASAGVSVSGPLVGSSCACSTPLAQDFRVGYAAGANVSLSTFWNQGSFSGTATFAFGEGWEEIGPAAAVEHVDGAVTFRVEGNSGSIELAGAFDEATFVTGHSGTVALSGEPDRRYRVRGRLYAMDRPYPGALALGLLGSPPGQPQSVTLAPGGSATVTQRAYQAFARRSDGGTVLMGEALEAAPIRSFLTAASLAANGEDPRDWVTMFAGRGYPAIRMRHAPSLPLPAPELVSGEWRHTFAPLPGDWEGYALLKVRVRTGAFGDRILVSVDGDPAKTWEIPTAESGWHDLTVDLLRPRTPEHEGWPPEEIGAEEPDPDAPDLWDSRYPLRNDGLPHRDRAGWGVGRVRSVSLAGLALAEGSALEVESLALVREGEGAVVDAAPAFLDWELAQTPESYGADGSAGSVPIVQGTRGFVATVDGRRSIVEPCSTRQLVADAAGNLLWVYGARTARDLKTTLNACPGWTSDESGYVPRDGWHALDGSEGANRITGGPIFYAGWSGFHDGGGVRWDGATPVNALGSLVGGDWAAATYQPRYHEVLGYPGMGDVWGDSGGEYGGFTELRVGKILRASVDGVARPSGAVRLRDEGGGEVSSATPDVRGRFRMGPLPLGKGGSDHSVHQTDGGGVDRYGEFVGEWDDGQGLGNLPAEHARWNARRWHRASFRTGIADVVRRWIAYAVDSGFHRHRRAIGGAGAVEIGRADNRLIWSEFATTFDATGGDLAISRDERAELILLLFTEGAGRVLVSGDDGESWTQKMDGLAGIDGAVVGARDTRRFAYRMTEAGDVYARAYDASWTAIGAETLVTTGAAAIDADESVSGGTWRMVLLVVAADGTRTTLVSLDGLSFTAP